MSRVEVLLATMHRTDMSAVQQMNIQTDIIIANQADRFAVEVADLPSGRVKMITTPDRGVGRNRNLGLNYSSGEFLLFADDGTVYLDGYEKTVSDSFDALPHADILLFRLLDENGVDGDGKREIKKTKRIHIWNFGRFGGPRIAIRRSSWQRTRLFFTELHGGGAIYGVGEDNLFLRNALRTGMKVYASPVTVSTDTQTESTWFRGFNDKFMFDGGALYAAMFPKLRGIAWVYYLLRMYKRTGLGFWRCAKLCRAGAKAQHTATSYAEWEKKHNQRNP